MPLNEYQEETAADFICKGILQKQEGGALRGTIPVLSFNLVEKYLDMWREAFTPLAQEYAQLLYDRQKDLMFPWIRPDLMNPAYWYVFPHYGNLEVELVKYGIGKNMIALPDGPKNACMSLVLLNDSFAGKGTVRGKL